MKGRTRKLRKRKEAQQDLNRKKEVMCKEITETLEDYRVKNGITEKEVEQGRFKCDSFGNMLQYYDNKTGLPILEVRKMKRGKTMHFHVTKVKWEELKNDLQKAKAELESGNGEVACCKA